MIGIITFHKAKNFGAVLQAYALCKCLNNLGQEAELINYYSPYIQKFYNPYNKISKRFLKDVLLAPLIVKKYRAFNHFLNSKCVLSNKVTDKKGLKQLANKYATIITGSDQVWNYVWSGFDKSYFLDFADTEKKYSYAASFGFNEIPQEFKEEYRKLLSDFKCITVREDAGQKIIEELLEYTVDVMPDPVCLIGANEWKEIYSEKIGKPYLLLYTLENSENIIEFAKYIAKEKGLQVRIICDSVKKKYDFIYESYISPERFVGLFSNAEYIITNSFHGTMFSILFNKRFFVKLQSKEGAPNSRLLQLIEKYDLTSVTLKDDCKEKEVVYLKNSESLNWEYINNILKSERQKAEFFLSTINNENKEKTS